MSVITVSSRYLPVFGLALTCVAPSLAHAWDIKMPWRGDALPANSYMRTTGHGGYNCPNGAGGGCGNDIMGVRWDSGAGSFSFSKTGINLTGVNDSSFLRSDSVAWGMELYAPVDGEIIACWSGIPDDAETGEDPAACPATAICHDSGNFMIIRTDDNHLVSLSHLQYQSIPAGLCPNNTGVVLNTDPEATCNFTGYQNVARTKTFLADPIPVEKGEFIGRVGVSGSAKLPHLHLGVYEYTNDAQGDPCQKGIPLEFSETFTQKYTTLTAPTATGWLPSEGLELNYDGSRYLMWGDPIGQRTDADTFAPASAYAVELTPMGGVAGYRDSGDLVLRGFGYSASETFTYGTTEVLPDVGDIALARIDDINGHVVAAFANSANKLQVVPFFVDSDHDLIEGTDRAELTAGVGLVEATRAPTHSGVVVAIQNSSNGISVIDYRVTSPGGSLLEIEREGNAESIPAITDLDIATVTQGRGLSEQSGAFKGVVTVERATNGNVRLRSWAINSAGTVTVGDDELVRDQNGGAAFTATDVDVTVTGNASIRQFVVVSMATPSGLRVQNWTVSTTGALVRVDQYEGGPVSHIDSARSGQQDAVVGVRITTAQMSLLSFQIEADGRLRRGGTIDGGNIAAIALDAHPSSEDLVVMPVAPTSLTASLQHYRTNYSSTL